MQTIFRFSATAFCLAGVIAFAGCRNAIAPVGPLSLQNPTRVPPPATGSYQTPSTYTPNAPTISRGTNTVGSISLPAVGTGTQTALGTDSDANFREASASLASTPKSVENAAESTVVQASFSSNSAAFAPSFGNAGVSHPKTEEVDYDSDSEAQDASESSSTAPTSITIPPTAPVNIQWRSPKK